MRKILLALVALAAALLGAIPPATAATVRVDYVRTSPQSDGAYLMAIDQMVDATGLLTVTTAAPLTGASRLTVPTPATNSVLQLYARITVLDGAVIVRNGADAAATGPGLYISQGDWTFVPVKAGDQISMVETTPVTQPSGGSGGSSGGLTDAQLRASPVQVAGSRPNDGSALASGNAHVSVGGSDGTNLRPLAVDTAGRAQVVVPDITAAGAITTQNLAGAVGPATTGSSVGFASLAGYATAVVQVTGTYSGALTPQATVDGTNWVTLGGTPIVNLSTGAYSTTIASAATGLYAIDITGYAGFRLVANAAVTGTATVSLRAAQSAQMVTLANPLPAGTNTIGAISALPAGTNAVGDVGVQYRATATGAAVAYHVVSAAGTNAAVIKATAGRLIGYWLTNTTASLRCAKLHNSATAPTAGAGVARTICLPPNGSLSAAFEGGVGFSAGIGITIVAGAADSDATAVNATDVVGEIVYQ